MNTSIFNTTKAQGYTIKSPNGLSEASTTDEIIHDLEAFNLFGDLLALYTERRGLNQSELSEIVSVDKSTVSNWYKGRRFPDSSYIHNLSEALELTDEERRILLISWSLTKTGQELIPYVKYASKGKANLSTISCDVVNCLLGGLEKLSVLLVKGGPFAND